jgi:hypothetical protein
MEMRSCRFSLRAVVAAIYLLATFANAAEKLVGDLIPLGLRARNSSPIPVEARFKWDGTRVLEGKLELEFLEGNRVLGRYRTDDLALTTGEQRFRILLPPLEQPFSDSQVEVRMKFVTADEVLNLDSSSLSVPTMSERAMSLGWCNAHVDSAALALDLEQSLMFEHFAPGLNPSEHRQLLTSMVRLNPEDLPMQSLSYTAFDVMVLTAEGFAEAHEGQLQTLARWVKGGGSVCVFVGGGLQSHHLAFLNELLDTNSAGPVFIADNTGHLLPGMQKISCLRSGVGRSVIVAGNLQPDPGLDSPAWREAVTFLWKIRDSQTQAILQSGHWEQATNSDWEGSFPTESSGQFRVRRPPRRPSPVVPMPAVQWGVQGSSLGAELITELMPKTVRLIPFPALLGTLGVFVLMIGPVDYYFLGWLRQRRYTWILFPAMSFVFTLGTVLMANHYLGLRDQRRSLIVVDVDKDGTPLRSNRYELVFAARDRQSVTEMKDALWAHLEADVLPGSGQMPMMMRGRAYNYNYNFNAQAFPPGSRVPYRAVAGEETAAAWYEGTLPAHYRTSKSLRQWQPELNRIFSFDAPPAPVLANWSAIEDVWPDLDAIRAKLSANRSFVGDVCMISSSDSRGFSQTADVTATNLAALSAQARAQMLQSAVDGSDGSAPPYQVRFDAASRRILPDSILAQLSLGDSFAGLRSVVSQISPTGGGNFEDVQVMDTTDSALAIVTQAGDDIVVYRRIFHGN